MKKLFAALAAVSVIAVAAPAVAQDAMTDETVSPAKNFSGLSINTVIGWDHLRSGSTRDIDSNADVKQSLDGIVFGGGIGFDVPLGDRLTLGAEAEGTTSSARWDNNNGVPNTFNLGRVKAERDFYAGGRLGFAMSPKTLLYVKGGYTNARFALRGNGGGFSSERRLDTDGWRAGAGIEQKLGDHGFGRLEYRYSNYQEGEFDFNDDVPDSGRFNIDTDRHQVVAAVGVRF